MSLNSLDEICADIDDWCGRQRKPFRFALVCWIEGEHENAKSVLVQSHPKDRAVVPVALATARAALNPAATGEPRT